MSHHDHLGAFQHLVEVRDELALFRSVHFHFSG
jgi:hypothetical protein